MHSTELSSHTHPIALKHVDETILLQCYTSPFLSLTLSPPPPPPPPPTHTQKVAFYIGELCRYLLAQPERPTDTQHKIRMLIGNGLRPQIWANFTRRFGIENIGEFYGSTESNAGMINPFNKVGACGFSLMVISFLNPQILVKVYNFTNTVSMYCFVLIFHQLEWGSEIGVF